MHIVGTNLKRRNKESHTSTVHTVHLCYDNSGGYTPNVFETRQYVENQADGYMVGWDVPDFHRRRNSGELLPFTEFRKFTLIGGNTIPGIYDYRITSPPYRRYFLQEAGKAWQNLEWRIAEDELSQHVDSSYVKYATNAAAKIYSQGFDALTWLAELKDVRYLWRSLSDKLLHLKLPKGFKGLSSEWLSYRYGWRQLLNDFNNLSKAVLRLNNERDRYSQRSGDTWTTTTNYSRLEEWGYLWIRKEFTDKLTISARGSVVADIEVPAFQFNPLQTGWEVIPLSFVVDWFVNVGKTLAAASFLVAAKAYSACWGVKVRLDRSLYICIDHGKALFYDGTIEQGASATAELEIRNPCSITIIPHHVLNMDRFKVMDLIGLIVQRLK